MNKERFSLLLLEPNEIYFEDFSVDLIQQTNNDEIITGRLKLCSKSLVFDPKNIELALIKLRLSDCYEITDSTTSNTAAAATVHEKNCLIIGCSESIDMLKKNIIAPYEFVNKKRNFIFHFHYASVNDYALQLCQQLHRASSLHATEQNDMIATIVFSRHNRLKFDRLWLENIYEQILFDCKVDEIHPLVINPGRFLLTNSCIYFQPYNNILPYPVIKIKLGSIISFTKRRFLLRHIGLEIMWKDEQNLYVSFRNSSERDNFYNLVEKQSDFKLPKIKPASMTLKWQNRLISNYDYLLYLNSLADRTFEDLTQYPIFPWIIIDYKAKNLNLNDHSNYRDLKKPIGALNKERLDRLKERAEEMGDPKYLYGSHYSTPGFVLFYLVRKYPKLMLCLQNGKFDHPDRMFNNIADTFNNCLTNMSDFKELIPEFYDTNQKGDFLLNLKKINFGQRSNGTQVNNVNLPLWANNSTEFFIQTLRDALESDYVSENLHHWIDLIFGYKQRGIEAEKADNVFYHLCYEGSVDLDCIKDAATRHALEVQISEFGQIPKQIFDKPHVSRLLEKSAELGSPMRTSFNEKCDRNLELKLKSSYSAHKDEITSIYVDDDIIVSTGKDGILKCYSISEQRQTRNISFGNVPLSSVVKIPNSNVYVVGSWDNSISLYNCNYAKISDVIPAHDDSISCLNLIENLGLLISASWDCSVKIWRGFNNVDYKTFRLSNAMIAYLSLDDKINCLTNRQFDNNLQIVIGTDVGEIILWNLPIQDIQNNTIYSDIYEPIQFLNHYNSIQNCQFNNNGKKLASCSTDGLLLVTDITTGMNLIRKNLDNCPMSLCWCNDIELLVVVDDKGYFWIWDLIEGDLKYNLKISNGPLTCIKYNGKNDVFIIGGKDNNEYKIKCWSLDE